VTIKKARALFYPSILKAPTLAILSLLVPYAPESLSAGASQSTVPIRIGWQIPAATQDLYQGMRE